MGAMQIFGSWAFVVGLIIAVVFGFFDFGIGSWIVWILAVLGVIVGLINVTQHEARLYLVAALAFMFSAWSLTNIFGMITGVLNNVITFVAPSAAVVAFRALYDLAKAQ